MSTASSGLVSPKFCQQLNVGRALLKGALSQGDDVQLADLPKLQRKLATLTPPPAAKPAYSMFLSDLSTYIAAIKSSNAPTIKRLAPTLPNELQAAAHAAGCA